MAANAAQNNINSGSSFTVDVPTTVRTPNISFATPIFKVDANSPSGGHSVMGFYTSGTLRGIVRADSVGGLSLESRGTGPIEFNYNGGSGGVNFFNGSSLLIARFANNGNVGIGASIPNAKLDVNGTFSCSSATIPIINGNTTFSNNIIGNGTGNTLPNQAISNNTSIMTRGLAVRDAMLSLGVVRDLFVSSGNLNTSGTGAANINDNLGASLIGANTANAWQRAGLTRVITGNPGASGAGQNCAIPIAIAVNFFCFIEAAVSTAEIRFIVGDSGSGAPPPIGANALTGRGWGVRIFYDGTQRVAKLCAHDGTTYSESSSIIPFAAGDTSASSLQNMVLASDGLGSIKLYYTPQPAINSGGVKTSSTVALSMSGGPISGNTSIFTSFLTLNGATPPTTQSQLKFLNAKLLTGEIF